MRRAALLVAAAALAACAPDGNGVELVLSADPALPDDTLARVAALVVTTSGVQSATKQYDVAGLKREERLFLRSSRVGGTLQLSIVAKTLEGLAVASADDTAELASTRVRRVVTLRPPSLAIAPTSATVTQGRTRRFTANLPVRWSVDEADGGTIDETGLYRAPAQAGGRYHVRATSQSDDALTVAAEVEVRPYGVEIVAGALGGRGAAPGMGATARVSSIGGFTVVGTDVYANDVGAATIVKMPMLGAQGLSQVAGLPFGILPQDGTGLDASFGGAHSIASSPNALFVPDWTILRRVDLATSQVTTIPTSRVLPLVRAAWFDGVSTLYFVGGNSVWKVDVTSGVVSRLAGISDGYADGDAATAQFSGPRGIVGDGSGNLYVADTGNHRIRKVVLAPQVMVSTIAGGVPAGCSNAVGTNARFDTPWGVSLFGTQQLLVADYGNHVIRSVDVTTGSVGTVVGRCGEAGQVDGGNAQVKFNHPIAVMQKPDSSGNVLISEEMSGVIRLYNGATTTLFGTRAQIGATDGLGPSARFSRITDVTSDGIRVFVADTDNNCVRVVNADGTVARFIGVPGEPGGVDGDATAARLNAPNGLSWNATQRRLYILDRGASTIRVWDDQAKTLSTLVGRDSTAGSQDGDLATARILSPSGVAVDADGTHLAFADGDGGVIRIVDLNAGTVSRVAGIFNDWGTIDGPLGTSKLIDAYGLVFVGAQLYVADVGALRRWDPTSGELTTVAGALGKVGTVDGVGTNARFRHINQLALDAAGQILISDAGALRRFNPATGQVTTLAGGLPRVVNEVGALPRALNYIVGVGVLESGDVVVGDSNEPVLLRIRYPE